MANYNPNITSSNATGSFSETANTTGSNALHNLSGTMNFTDRDRSDTHTTSSSLKSAVLSSGSVIPGATLAHINSAMSSTIQSDSNGSGKLKWTFSAEDDDFDFLAKNQTLTLTYEVKLFDNHGGSTKKTVTVTITGTDDKPVIDFGVNALVSEQENQTLSLSPDTVNVAVHFVDVDLTNTGHTATVIDVSASGATGGLLPGVLGELELRSFFHINNVVKTSGSSNGTINTTFSAPDLAFDYLSEGEIVDITYTIRLNDNAGGITTQTVVITVVGSNDAPKYFCGPDTASLVEGEDLSPAGDLTASGDLPFADIDLSDGHTVSTSVTTTRSGGGAVPLTEAQLLAALSTTVSPDSTNHLFGEVDWAFALDNDDVSFLNSGETLTITYTVTLIDDAGGTDTEIVTVTILGTNDAVIVTSGPGAASLAEFADVTGDPTPNSTTPVPTGSITFTDTDVGDTHSVNVTVANAAWSAGGAAPAATLADLPAALITTLNDSTGSGSGSVDWSFSIPDFDLDFLAAGETLEVTYDVAISDGPTSASQTVTITIDGANDLPVITSGPGSDSTAEQPGVTGSPDPDTGSGGTLSFTDVDLSDTHTVSVLLNSAVWSSGGTIPTQTETDLLAALSAALSDSTGSGSGSVDWSFSIPDFDLDFLAGGETLTVTYDIVVADAFASSTQTVTVTITGAEDPLIVNPLSATVSDTVAIDDGSLIFLGNVIADAGDSAGDFSTTLSISDVNGSAANVGVPISGAYGSLFIAEDGTYFFVADASLDLLPEGATASESYTFTVTDSLGRSETETLTLNFTGSNEAPIIVSAAASGSVTEDRGPTVLTNGDFETGDLTGWTASSSLITVEFLGNGGVFEDYTVRLAPGPTATLSQDVVTTPGLTYTLTFYVSGDSESTNNQFTASWDGVQILQIDDNQVGGLTAYTFSLVGGAGPTTHLEFSYFDDDGIAMYLDHVEVLPASGPATEETDGSVSFTDPDSGDTHTASFVAQGGAYFGTFSLDPVSESSGSGSVVWHFTVDNADIQFLAEGETLTQVYTVSVNDGGGAFATQDVTVTIVGTNDAPSATVDDTIITDADVNNGLAIPQWALGWNDVDPDTADTLGATNVGGASGGSVVDFGVVLFFDDATLGGSFTYQATDGTATGPTGTATVINTAAGSNLTGTGADEILVSAIGDAASLDGGGGDDILIGNTGAHTLTGGSGDDVFAFEQVPDALNTITDFTSGGDMIAISAGAFGSGLAAGMDTSLVFESSPDDQFFGAIFHYDTTNSVLYFSSDGTTASAIVVAQLQSGAALNAQDLMIV
jgi:VCBS repeat-containing protein